MLAVVELRVSANGGVGVGGFGTGGSRCRFFPVWFGSSRRHGESVQRVQTVQTSFERIARFVRLCFDLYVRVSLRGGAVDPVGAAVSV